MHSTILAHDFRQTDERAIAEIRNDLSATVRRQTAHLPLPAAPPRQLAELKANGLTDLATMIASPDHDRLIEFVSRPERRVMSGPPGPSHGWRRPLSDRHGHHGSLRPIDAAAIPGLAQIASHCVPVGLAAAYLGCAPTLIGVHAWWSFAECPDAGPGQQLHRDFVAYHSCSLVLLLSAGDVVDAFEYLTGSHDRAAFASLAGPAAAHIDAIFDIAADGYRQDNLYHDSAGDLIAVLAATAQPQWWMIDFSGVHAFVPPRRSDVFFLRLLYGHGEPLDERQHPTTEAHVLRQIGVVANPMAIEDLPSGDIRQCPPPRNLVTYSDLVRVRDGFAAARRQRERDHGVALTGTADPALLGQLNRAGYAPLGSLLSSQQLGEVRRYFEPLPCLSGYIIEESDGVLRSFDATRRRSAFACYRLSDVIAAPYLLELANNPDILKLIERYFGCIPTLYSLNVWWSFPTAEIMPGQHWHRDREHYKLCTLFVYLSDSDGSSGSHLYMPGTHDRDATAHLLRSRHPAIGNHDGILDEIFALDSDGQGNDELYEEFLGADAVEFAGRAGMAFVEDTFGLHMGRPPQTHSRLAMWARYTLSDPHDIRVDRGDFTPLSTLGDPARLLTERLPDDPVHGYVNAALVTKLARETVAAAPQPGRDAVTPSPHLGSDDFVPPSTSKPWKLIAGLAEFCEAIDPATFGDVRARLLHDHQSELLAFLVNPSLEFLRRASFGQRRVAKDLLRSSVLDALPPAATAVGLPSGKVARDRLDEIRSRGICDLGACVEPEQLREISAYLTDKPLFNQHIADCSDGIPRRIGDPDDPAEAYQFGSYAEDVIARLPHLSTIVLNEEFLTLMKHYFRIPPILLNLHCWWSFSSFNKYGPSPDAGQIFHRDFRSLQDVQLFICLTEMPDDDGAHEYLGGTHDPEVFARNLPAYSELRDLPRTEALRRVFFPDGDGYGEDGDERRVNAWLELLRPSLVRIPMRAGHGFLIDTMGLHRGVPPLLRPRLVLSARFSASGAEPRLFERGRGSEAQRLALTERAYTLSAFRHEIAAAPLPEDSSGRGAKRGAIDADGLTPAGRAISLRRELLDDLAQLGRHTAALEQTDRSGHTPLSLAIECQDIEAIDLLISLGADPLRAFLQLCQDGDPATLVHVIGAMKEARFDFARWDEDGSSILTGAVQSDQPIVVEAAIAAGCDLNAANHAGQTALVVALARGQDDVARLLIGHGADLEGARAYLARRDHADQQARLDALIVQSSVRGRAGC